MLTFVTVCALGLPSCAVLQPSPVKVNAGQGMPADLLNWRGWSYLDGTKPSHVEPFIVSYDWAAIKPVPIPKAETPLEWHERIVVFSQTESTVKDSFGVAHTDRHAFEAPSLKRVQDAIGRLTDTVSYETGGRVKFVPEVTVEPETMRQPSFGSEFARSYLAPRINGGGYEAEDKIFRGPYQGALCLLPGMEPAPTQGAWINGTPVEAVWEYAKGVAFAPGDLEVRLEKAWVREVHDRLVARHLQVAESGSAATTWHEATATSEPSTEDLLSRVAAQPVVALFTVSGDIGPADGLELAPKKSFETASTEAAIGPDPDHGQVLHIAEKGVDRNGGFALPTRADGQALALVSKTPTFTFDIKTSARNAIGIVVRGHQGEIQFSLGRQWTPSPIGNMLAVPLSADGKWQHVALDIRSLASAAHGDEVTALEIAPTTADMIAGRAIAEPIELDLDNVKFTNDSPTPSYADPQPSAGSGDAEERAMFAVKASQPSPELLALLADKSQLVRLNAAIAFQRIKDAGAPAALDGDITDLDPAVAEAALVALNFQGGPTALPKLRRTVRFGITPLARSTAAKLLGDLKDPAYGDDIVSLIADRSRLCRLASVEALAGVPGKEAAIRRMAFIDQEDPEIKLAVTRSADPTDEYEMRKLLWSAVNEPSDLVRAESDIRLIQSPDAAFRTEGYKGVHDDSETTRLFVLDYLAKHPSEQNRTALRLAVTDRSAVVRARALAGFASLDKGAETDEIANVMQDRDPDVQLALLALSKKSGLKLSDQTRQIMATSPDQRVKQALGGQ